MEWWIFLVVDTRMVRRWYTGIQLLVVEYPCEEISVNFVCGSRMKVIAIGNNRREKVYWIVSVATILGKSPYDTLVKSLVSIRFSGYEYLPTSLWNYAITGSISIRRVLKHRPNCLEFNFANMFNEKLTKVSPLEPHEGLADLIKRVIEGPESREYRSGAEPLRYESGIWKQSEIRLIF